MNSVQIENEKPEMLNTDISTLNQQKNMFSYSFTLILVFSIYMVYYFYNLVAYEIIQKYISTFNTGLTF